MNTLSSLAVGSGIRAFIAGSSMSSRNDGEGYVSEDLLIKMKIGKYHLVGGTEDENKRVK